MHIQYWNQIMANAGKGHGPPPSASSMVGTNPAFSAMVQRSVAATYRPIYNPYQQQQGPPHAVVPPAIKAQAQHEQAMIQRAAHQRQQQEMAHLIAEVRDGINAIVNSVRTGVQQAQVQRSQATQPQYQVIAPQVNPVTGRPSWLYTQLLQRSLAAEQAQVQPQPQPTQRAAVQPQGLPISPITGRPSGLTAIIQQSTRPR